MPTAQHKGSRSSVLLHHRAQTASKAPGCNQHQQHPHSPRPTAVPTSSLPSGRSGGSAAGLPTLPFTVPRASAMTWMPPRGPSPLKVTCSTRHHRTSCKRLDLRATILSSEGACQERATPKTQDSSNHFQNTRQQQPRPPRTSICSISFKGMCQQNVFHYINRSQTQRIRTCVRSPSSRKAPMSSVPSSARPSAAEAVGEVL